MEKEELKFSTIVKVFLTIFVILLVGSSFTLVEGGERGVVFSKTSGVQEYVFNEGFHFKKPVIDEIIKYEVRTTKFEMLTESSSSDQQIVKTTAVLNYHLNPETVNKLYQEIGTDYVNRIIKPALEGSIKSAMAKFKAEELIQKRTDVTTAVKEDLKLKLDSRYIIVDDLNLVNIDFTDVYNKAIEAKVTAEQEALRAKNELEKTKIEAEQTIVRAEANNKKVILEAQAEAEAIKIKQEALSQSNEVLSYKWIETWDGKLPTYYGGNSNLLLTMESQK